MQFIASGYPLGENTSSEVENQNTYECAEENDEDCTWLVVVVVVGFGVVVVGDYCHHHHVGSSEWRS